jgi:hypothetical protein
MQQPDKVIVQVFLLLCTTGPINVTSNLAQGPQARGHLRGLK